MNRKHVLAMAFSTCLLITACNSNSGSSNGSSDSATSSESRSSSTAAEGTNPKGIGPHQNVQLTHPLDANMVAAGQKIYDVKCGSCHKTTDEKLVGPGWKGVTDRRTPEWIMNFVTNTEEMVEKDIAAQNMLEVCLVKMPNQGLSESDARSVLEFMRKNDNKQ